MNNKLPKQRKNTGQPPSQTGQPSATGLTRHEFYQGPVPPPAILAKLEEIVPGSAERIIKMAEFDQHAAYEVKKDIHARATQSETNAHKESMTSMYMAFAICILFTVCGTVLLMNGFEKAGGALVCVTLINIVGGFLGKRIRRSTTKEKVE